MLISFYLTEIDTLVERNLTWQQKRTPPGGHTYHLINFYYSSDQNFTLYYLFDITSEWISKLLQTISVISSNHSFDDSLFIITFNGYFGDFRKMLCDSWWVDQQFSLLLKKSLLVLSYRIDFNGYKRLLWILNYSYRNEENNWEFLPNLKDQLGSFKAISSAWNCYALLMTVGSSIDENTIMYILGVISNNILMLKGVPYFSGSCTQWRWQILTRIFGLFQHWLCATIQYYSTWGKFSFFGIFFQYYVKLFSTIEVFRNAFEYWDQFAKNPMRIPSWEVP